MNATPEFPPSGYASGGALSGLVGRFLQAAHLPADQPLMWVGVDLSITNTGQQFIELVNAGGPGGPVLNFLTNGRGFDVNQTESSLLVASGAYVGVPGCPFPFTSYLTPGASVSGCVALAVPAGEKVSTVGFDLAPASEGSGVVAQWRTGT